MTGEVPSTDSLAGQVLYRKWRPQTFAEVVGQEPVTRTLRNSVASGKVAHAYLLCGPRGTGKTSLGRLVAKAVNCGGPAEGEPCNQCDSCRAFLEGRALDLVELDAASNRGIDEIRKLKDRVGLAPMGGRYKVYLVDEVHMLTPEAYNALLKTLEEPPPHVIFVLATTEPHKVPATIISRCQRFDLRRIPLSPAVECLAFVSEKEGFGLDEVALQEIARSAAGSLRDAINMLEQITTYYGPTPDPEQVREALGLSMDARSRDLARCVLRRDLTEGLKVIGAVRDDGVEMRQFSRQVVGYLRNLLLVKSGAGDTLDLAREQIAEMQSLAGEVKTGDVIEALRAFGRVDFRDDPQSSLPLELALVEFAASNQPAGVEPAPRPSEGKVKAPALAPPAPEAPAPEAPAPEAPAPEAPAPKAPASEAEPEAPAAEVEPEAAAEPEAVAIDLSAADAPVAPPEAAGPAPSPDALSPDFLERVRLACKDVHKQVAGLLNGSCEVKALEGDTIVLGVYYGFHLEKIDDPANRRVIEGVASQLLGRPVTIRCERAEEPPPQRTRGGHLV
ncbi:MAG: DNA polymerase III subunit gamma/tau, partial [Chloroflexi bacterium]|nr:DNA polymerase III subunit gamma/tau [Chloroflexota bacterium]